MLGISGQQDTAACPSRPLQPQALSGQAQLYATQILEGDSQGWLEPASWRPAVERRGRVAEKSERGVRPTGEPRPQPCSLTRSPPSPSTHKACGQTQPRDTDTPQAGLPTPVAPKRKGKLMRNETREAAARPSADRTSSLLVPTAHASQPLCRPRLPPTAAGSQQVSLPGIVSLPPHPPHCQTLF